MKNYVAKENTSFMQKQQIGHRIDLVKVVALIISYCHAALMYNGIPQSSERVLKLCKESLANMNDHLPPGPSSTP